MEGYPVTKLGLTILLAHLPKPQTPFPTMQNNTDFHLVFFEAFLWISLQTLQKEHSDFSGLQLGQEASGRDIITLAVTGVLAIFAPGNITHPS